MMAGPLRLVDGQPDPSSFPKCSLFLRGGARAFDVAMAIGISVVGRGAGPVLALLFVLLADGLLQGQSAGKRVFGVKVMHVPTRSAARYRESFLRNAPFGLVVLMAMLPPGLGGKACVAGAVVIGLVESWKVLRHPLGLRYGDVWADTQVIDGKIPIGQQLLRADAPEARAAGRVLSAARPGRAVKSRREAQCASR